MLNATTLTLYKKKRRKYIHMPTSFHEIYKTPLDLGQVNGFPKTKAVFDGTHIPIKATNVNEHEKVITP